MRTLSTLSFLGLLAFIAFSTVGRADVYHGGDDYGYEDGYDYGNDYGDDYDHHDDYQSGGDTYIENNINVQNNIWINGQVYPRNYHPTPVYPNWGYGYGAVCVAYLNWNAYGPSYLLINGRRYQIAPRGLIINTYQTFVYQGRCRPGGIQNFR